MIRTKEVIKIYKEEVEIWNAFKNYKSEIITYLYRYTYNFLGIKWNTSKIEQDIPYIKDAFYDGEYSCNRYLKGIAEREYNKMKFKK